MASFQKEIEVSTIDGLRSRKLRAWVDTGAAYTWIPQSVLENLGIAPSFRRRFRLASGAEIERDCAQATISVDGSRSNSTNWVVGHEGNGDTDQPNGFRPCARTADADRATLGSHATR